VFLRGRPGLGLADRVRAAIGTYPIQVVPEGNAAAHVQDTEARPQKRAFTLEELQDGEPPRQVRRLQP
jgi:hypothetical protein